MRITTRKVTQADKESLRRIHHECYRDVVTRQFGSWEESVQDSFFEKDWECHPYEVIEVDGHPIGSLSVEETPNQLILVEVQILPRFQGKGIGSNLIRGLQQRAISLSKSVHLRVLKENRARSLYSRLGFQEASRTDTHILMEWRGTNFVNPQAYTEGAPE